MSNSITVSTAPTTAVAPVVEAQPVVPAVVAAGSPMTTPVVPVVERPAWLPEKFTDAESLAKAYAELEKKQSTTKVDPLEIPAAPEVTAEETAAAAVLADKGLSFDDYAAEYAKDGKLSDATITALDKAGIPRTMVDSYIAGQVALAANITTTLHEAAGGKDQYGQMVEWAAANLSDSDKEAYNRVMNGGDVNSASLAIRGLKAQFEEVNGKTPARVVGGATTTSEGDVFESIKQLTAAIGDPLYAKDPAFRAKVEAKLARSNF